MAAAFDPSRIDWNLLRAFVAVVEQGSLTRAAEQLGSSQPTLSRQLAALEAIAGAPLFERTARRLVPSAQARAMAEPAARMLAAAQACAVAVAAPAEQLAGTVRLTASQVVSAHVLPGMLLGLARAHPEIQIELVASNTVENLLERDADIALRMVRPTQAALVARRLADQPLGLYAHADLVRSHGKPSAANMLEFPWVGFDRSDQLLRGFRDAGYPVRKDLFGFRCDHQVVAWQAVVAGLGIGVTTQRVAALFPQLLRVLPKVAIAPLPMWLTAHRELRGTPRLKLVFDTLAQALAR